jgi:carbonic anhydrase/acetyltransferase-like protein (isoleucine patch superfamily)
MKVYVQPTGRRAPPFEDDPDEVLIHNQPLAWWRRRALEEAGLEVIDQPQPTCLVIPDTLWTTGEVLRAFVDQAAGREAVMVLADSRFADYNLKAQPRVTRVASGWRFEEVRLRTAQGGEPTEVVIDPEEKVLSIPVPQHYFGTSTLELGFARRPAMPIEHWSHIIWANQAASALEARLRPRWRWILWGLWAMLRAWSLNKWKILARMNTIGENCDIHPTAVVEMSVLGDNVVVGPHARVRFSRLADGCFIMAGAQVEHATLGKGCAVSQNCALNFSVMYPGSICSMDITQLSLFGRDVITTAGSYCMDLNFDRNIRVPIEGELVDTGSRTLGCALGHRVKLGCGVWISSGRMIPNDYFVVRSPEGVIRHLPEGMAEQGALANRAGRLAPISAPGDEQ